MVVMGGAVRFLRSEGEASPHDRGEGPFTILVASTVDPNESVELISRVLEACRDMDGVRIVIRCHPDLPFDRIAPLLGQGLPPHATATPGSPVQLREVNALVFSSTSVAVEALAAGVPVIQILTMDPLNGNRFEGIPPSKMLRTARTNEELRLMVDALRAEDITPRDRREAAEIAKLFFGPVDDGVYALFLPEGREHGSPGPGISG
jgi:hypothetical protein